MALTWSSFVTSASRNPILDASVPPSSFLACSRFTSDKKTRKPLSRKSLACETSESQCAEEANEERRRYAPRTSRSRARRQ